MPAGHQGGVPALVGAGVSESVGRDLFLFAAQPSPASSQGAGGGLQRVRLVLFRGVRMRVHCGSREL